MLEDKPSQVSLIKDEVMKHVTNFGNLPDYAESPTKAVISIKTGANTPYKVYIDVLDEVWLAYFEIWDAESRKYGAPDFATYNENLADRRRK